MKKALSSLLIIGIVGALAVGLSSGFFSDTETSTDNQFTAGELDLEIDNESYYNGILQNGGDQLDLTWSFEEWANQLFFNFDDVKPEDYGEDTISLHAENDYWLCMDMLVTKDDDNTCTTPEQSDDVSCNEPDGDLFDGELGGEINFAWWVDDGDNVLETDEIPFISDSPALSALNQSIVLADSQTNLFEDSGPLVGGNVYYIGKVWCFGNMGLSPLTQDNQTNAWSPDEDNNENTIDGEPEDGGFTCDGSLLNNATQSDILMGDITFNAYQARNNPNFLCEPVQISCEERDEIFASDFSNNNQGLRKDGTAVLANRSVPGAAFGTPESAGLPEDLPVPPGSFFSLGFAHDNNGNTPGNIVFEFAEPFYNGPGDDLQIFEVTGTTTPPYPDEIVKVEVGPTSAGPWTEVAAAAIRDELIDIDPVVSAQFVRLTDVSDVNLFSGTGDATPDGYDLDAVKAFCTEVAEE